VRCQIATIRTPRIEAAAETAAILAQQEARLLRVNSAKTGGGTVLKYTMAGAALAAIGLYAM
jgi:hypothetical protein